MIKKLFKKIIGKGRAKYIKSLIIPDNQKSLISKRKLFYLKFLNSGDLYFDIGANYGNRIEPIINLGINIIAIEPQEQCIKYLKLKFENKIEIVQKGLGAREGIKEMFISDNDTLSSFSEDWIKSTRSSGRFQEYQWVKTEKVEITTLDKLISKYGVPKFIKIDVEGFEYEVLKGLTKAIEFISYEYTVPEQTQKAVLCLERLRKLGNDNYVFNYSIGESMEMALETWVSPRVMIKEINSERFRKSAVGDIYAHLST